ncbi:hypothetical protein MYX76_17290 [Desulfobacterota bacterium AH_259_B03_O07]|nr:hypothetical protein [Desulfobacterota bacterium AH_259_B03_O07]
MAIKSIAGRAGVVVVAVVLLAYGILTREEPPISLGWVTALTVAIVVWGEWSKRRPDYDEGTHDRFMPVAPIASLLLYVLTGSLGYYLLGGVGLIVTYEAVFGDTGIRMGREQSDVDAFLQESCVLGDSYEVGTGALYGYYVDWARGNGTKVLPEKVFVRRLKSCGIVRDTSAAKPVYRGCRLI